MEDILERAIVALFNNVLPTIDSKVPCDSQDGDIHFEGLKLSRAFSA